MTATRPNSRKARRNADVIDQAAATGMQIYGDIWAVPGAVLDQTIATGLRLKDAVKGKVKHLVRRNSVDLGRRSGLFGRATGPAIRRFPIAQRRRAWQGFINGRLPSATRNCNRWQRPVPRRCGFPCHNSRIGTHEAGIPR